MVHTISVHEATVATSSAGCFVSWQFVSALEDNTNEFAFTSHPLFSVETDITRDHCVKCVIGSHFNLTEM